MADTVTLHIQVPKADFDKIEANIKALGSKPVTISIPGDSTKKIGEDAKYAAGTVGSLKEAIKKLNTEIDELGDSKAIADKQKEIAALEKEVSNLTNKNLSKNDGLTQSLTGMLPSITKIGVATAAVGIGGQLVSDAWDKFIAKDAAIRDMQAITGLTAETTQRLADSATELSNEFGTSAISNIEAMKTVLSKLGPEVAESEEDLNRMTRSINLLSKTSPALADTGKTAEILAKSLNSMGLASADTATKAAFFERATNVIAAGAQAGAIEADQLAEALIETGSTFQGTNVSLEEGIAAIEVLGQVMANGAENGNALKNVQLKLQEGRFIPPDTQAALVAAGVDIAKLSDNSLTLADRLEVLKPVVDDTALIVKFFGTENVVAAQHMIRNTDALRGMTKATNDQTAATRQAETQMAGYTERWDRITNRISNGVIGTFERLRDGIVDITDAFDLLMKGDIAGHFEKIGSSISNAANYATLGLWDKIFGGDEAPKASKKVISAFGDVETSVKQGMIELGAVEISGVRDSLNKLRADLEEANTRMQGATIGSKAYRDAAADVNRLQKRLEALTSTTTKAPPGSILALQESLSKLEDNFKRLKISDPNWLVQKDTIAETKKDIDTILSGAAAKWGNDIQAMKGEIQARAKGTILEPLLLGKSVADYMRDAKLTEIPVPEMPAVEDLEKFVESYRDVVDQAISLSATLSSGMAQAIVDNQPVLKSVLKGTLGIIFEYLNVRAEAAIAEYMISKLGLGPFAVIASAVVTGLIMGVLKGIEGKITGFARGGVLVGENGPEVIAPAREFSEFAGNIVSSAIGFMEQALSRITTASGDRRVAFQSNLSFGQARVTMERGQLVWYLNVEGYREAKRTLSVL